MMKKLLFLLFIISSFNLKGTIHTIGVWGGYYQFVPASITMQLGDTLQWEPYFGMLPTMLHTITSDNIPSGAVPFDQVWQMPADTFFQYIPQVAGLYQYVCTPHIPNGMIGEFTVINVATAQKTYVPDDNFEAYLEANGMGDGIQLNDSVSTVSIEMLISLDISFQNISDLTGIEDFISLSVLYCWNNNLTTLDLSHNTALTELHCQDNSLTTLDLSNNTSLTDLRCQFTGITSIDLSGAISLADLRCQHNQLTSLDISQNVDLLYLDCKHNQLTQLDIRNGNNTNMIVVLFENPNLFCINVDDPIWANLNWTNIDNWTEFSNDCDAISKVQEHSTNKELLKVTDLLGRETKQTNQPLFYIYDDGTVEKRINIE